MKTTLRDGLYHVETATISAGFVVERGRVTRWAPILKRHLKMHVQRAEEKQKREFQP